MDAPVQPPPPDLPQSLMNPIPVIVAGSGIWAAILIGVLIFDRQNVDLIWTCVAGIVLGIIGYAIVSWQQAAARRGSKTAQPELRKT